MAVTYDFAGKTAIVTGGSRGIGRAVAAHLARSGADVWIWDADPVPADGIRNQTVDVTKAGDIKAALTEIVAGTGRIDILVNNAGYLGPYHGFETFDPAEWQRIIGVNLLGTFEVTHQVLPVMRQAGRGRIVNMGSLAGKEGLPNLAAYCGERRRHRLHQSAVTRGLRHRYSRQLRCAWSNRHRPYQTPRQ